ncbi:glycosyl hydrolase-like protein [Novymonas esmeraldas]|uniref:Glycosyl hydrolase-like protein n=1 Tax=Novymonas esmeraldas TaxID=1808958 RepID=A0AAW0F543_9TRYP
MSSSSTRDTAVVSLYRYDLSQGMARSLGPMLIGRPLEGIWHTAIVVYGKEYYFDGGVGVVGDPHPGRTRFGAPYRVEVLGHTTRREEEFFAWTQQQRRSGFGPADYRLFDNNCNSFSDAASMYLLGRHISQDVLDMIPTLLSTPMGQMLRPMLEQATSGGAGIGGIGMAAPPPSTSLAAPPPPPPQLPAPAAGSRDACAGLLSRRQALTESDEDDLVMAQAMLESNETIADGHDSPAEAFEKTIGGLVLLRTVMENICTHPREAKYRAISTESNAYRTKLKALETYGVTEVLRIAGFRRRPHSNGSGGEQWYLADSEGSHAVLRRVADVLEATIANIQAAADDAATRRGMACAAGVPDEQTDSHASTAAVKDGDAAPCGSRVLRFCTAPFPAGWEPLEVGREGGVPLFSIHCLPNSTADGPCCFGKCRLSPAHQHVQALYCSSDGREVDIDDSYEVLCVLRGQTHALAWVPAALASSANAAAARERGGAGFMFTGYGRFGVVRAEHGGGVHPGVMEPSGRCVVPYGGRAVVVTEDAEVLCEVARLPPAVLQATQALQRGAELAALLRAASGLPIASFGELLTEWKPPAFYTRPQPLRPHTSLPVAAALGWNRPGEGTTEGAAAAERRKRPLSSDDGSAASGDVSAAPSMPRLLVCHDMAGGYTRADRRVFLCGGGEAAAGGAAASSRARLEAVEGAYTVDYWDRVDTFVYFSHKRISVPPREWIDVGHRHGVPVLATLITEGDDGEEDLRLLLTDAKRMAAIIDRLVDVCHAYGFDGYLINVENSLPKSLAKRLVVFCTQLRKQLGRLTSSSPSSSASAAAAVAATAAPVVIWYDAVTIGGQLSYQNAVNAHNKPFFDVTDGIFTNYFWNPMHLALTKTAAGPRSASAYVGVDVFGRNMYGGGGYNTHVAVAEAAQARLSVALFAPGWSLEVESGGTRDGFAAAESRLWSRMQSRFAHHAPVLAAAKDTHDTVKGRTLCAWTTFRSGVGYDFYVNGRRITGAGGGGSGGGAAARCASGWCELSGAQAMPPFLFDEPPSALNAARSPPLARGAPFAPLCCQLPAVSLRGGMYGGIVRSEWRYDKAWLGDRHLACLVPPMEAAEVLRWYVRDALPAAAAADLSLELVFDAANVLDGGAELQRGLRLALYSATRGILQVSVWEKTAVAATEAAPVTVAGVSGLVVSASRSEGDDGGAAAVSEGGPGTGRWVRVRYQLRNTSSETLHLVSIAVANGDESRRLSCGLGGVAVVQTRCDRTPVASTVCDGVLHASGPHQWTSFQLLRTRKASEQVLVLKDAESVMAGLRDDHGADASVLVFASLVAAAVEDRQRGAASADTPAREDAHVMYVGRYSLDPAAGTTYDGAILASLSIPADVVVSAVCCYAVPGGG